MFLDTILLKDSICIKDIIKKISICGYLFTSEMLGVKF